MIINEDHCFVSSDATRRRLGKTAKFTATFVLLVVGSSLLSVGHTQPAADPNPAASKPDNKPRVVNSDSTPCSTVALRAPRVRNMALS